MPRFILKLDGLYCEWSTIVDAPVSDLMTLEEFHEHIREEYGAHGLRELPERMKRVESCGFSLQAWQTSVEDIISLNRAGPNEECLTREQIVEQYRRKPENAVPT